MNKRHLAISLCLLLVVSGCSRLGGDTTARQFGSNGGVVPSTATAQAASATDLRSFVSASTLSQLSDKEKAEATSAQYYALQFGRPGAPRSWEGDTGASGKVSVGPYVRVNNLNCRDFKHVVTVSDTSYSSDGTACREADGSWNAVDS